MVVIPAVMVMYVDGSSAFAKSSTTTMRGVLQQQINGIKYPLKYTYRWRSITIPRTPA